MMSAPQQLFIVKGGCACVCPYLDVLLDLVSALLMTSEGADCRLWAKVFIFCTVRERERGDTGQCKAVAGGDGLHRSFFFVCIP